MARFTRLDTLVVTLRSGLMPLFFNPDASTAIRLVEALDVAGVRVIEFTNRGDGAHLVFAELEQECRRRMPDIVLGVGSVLDAGTASMYLNLGASFVVSPTLSAEVADGVQPAQGGLHAGMRDADRGRPCRGARL